MPMTVMVFAFTENPPTVLAPSWAGILDWRKRAEGSLQLPPSCFPCDQLLQAPIAFLSLLPWTAPGTES